jgi:hypothetical protein
MAGFDFENLQELSGCYTVEKARSKDAFFVVIWRLLFLGCCETPQNSGPRVTDFA